MENPKMENNEEPVRNHPRYPSIHPASINTISDQDQNEMEINYLSRKKIREHRISRVQAKFQKDNQTRPRQKQNIILYFINLIWLIVISCFNAYVFIKLAINGQLKGIVLVVFAFTGLLFSLLSNIMVAPWQEVIKLYFILDSIIPVAIAALIGFYTVLDFLSTNEWYETCYAIAFPVTVVYVTGYLRVLIVYSYWERWQIIFYKLSMLVSGLIFFYIGFVYLNGGYKITKGFLVNLETQLKDLSTLYVFGLVELFFEFYRKLSQFDQTDDLKYEYFFSDTSKDVDKRIAEVEMKNLKQEALQEEIQDIIASKWNILEPLEIKEERCEEKEEKGQQFS